MTILSFPHAARRHRDRRSDPNRDGRSCSEGVSRPPSRSIGSQPRCSKRLSSTRLRREPACRSRGAGEGATERSDALCDRTTSTCLLGAAWRERAAHQGDGSSGAGVGPYGQRRGRVNGEGFGGRRTSAGRARRLRGVEAEQPAGSRCLGSGSVALGADRDADRAADERAGAHPRGRADARELRTRCRFAKGDAANEGSTPAKQRAGGGLSRTATSAHQGSRLHATTTKRESRPLEIPTQPKRRCVWKNRVIDPEARFWAKVVKDGPIPEHRPDLGPCWQWTAYIDRDGYARFHYPGGLRAHRFSLKLAGIDTPKQLHVDHLCRNRGCVNPAHLELVTCLVNVQRGEAPNTVLARLGVCKRGHPLVEGNVRFSRKDGTCRQCKTCKDLHNKARSPGNQWARDALAT